jgi:hypothetical protein
VTHGRSAFGGPTMRSTTSDWEVELAQWLKPFFRAEKRASVYFVTIGDGTAAGDAGGFGENAKVTPRGVSVCAVLRVVVPIGLEIEITLHCRLRGRDSRIEVRYPRFAIRRGTVSERSPDLP